MKLLLAFLNPYRRNLLLKTLTEKCNESLSFGHYVAADEMATLIHQLGFEVQAAELWNKIRTDKESRDLIVANQIEIKL